MHDAVADMSPRRRLGAAWALSMGATVASIGVGSINVALPTIATDLGVEPSQAVFIVTIYQTVLLMTVLPLSALGEKIGPRLVYQWGQAIFVVASIAAFWADSLALLVLLRGIQALGAAAIFSVSMVLLRAVYPHEKLGRGMAVNTLVSAGAAAIAPTLGGFIVSVASWPWIFMACVPVGLVSLAFSYLSLPDMEKGTQPYDVVAAILCAAMFGAAVFALEGLVHGDSWMDIVVLATAAVAIGTVFIRRERGQANPILPIDLMGSRKVALPLISTFAVATASMLALLSLPFRLETSFGYTPAEAGLMLAAWTSATMIIGPLAGLMSDRVPSSVIGSLGMAIGAVGLVTLAFLPEAPSHFDLIWRLALSAGGLGLFYAPNARQIILSVPMARAAAAGGLAQTMRMTGQVLGSSATAAFLAMGIAVGPAPALLACGLTLVSMVCCLALLGTQRRPIED
jgi:DHA2 family multidrug resistance protein-like MFS transporter